MEGNPDVLERVVPGELGLPLLQDLDDVGLPKKRHYLVIVGWRNQESGFYKCVCVCESVYT